MYTNSEIASWRACPQLHEFKYVQLRRSRTAASSLGFGLLIHYMLEAMGKARMDFAADLSPLRISVEPEPNAFDLAKAQAMLVGYLARWGKPFEFLAVEHQWEKQGVGGKMDGVIRRNGRVLLLEYKTTSDDIAPGSNYWANVAALDEQVTRYLWALRGTPWESDTCLYDVLRKPDIRPLGVSSKRAAPETPAEYFERCCAVIAKEPDKYYARAEIVRTSDQIDQFEEEQMQTIAFMEWARSKNYHPRNTKSCHMYNRDCEFIGVCAGYDSIDNDLKFRTADTKHEELAPNGT